MREKFHKRRARADRRLSWFYNLFCNGSDPQQLEGPGNNSTVEGTGWQQQSPSSHPLELGLVSVPHLLPTRPQSRSFLLTPHPKKRVSVTTRTGTGTTFHVRSDQCAGKKQENVKTKPGEPQNAETSQDTLLSLQQTSSREENEEGVQIKREEAYLQKQTHPSAVNIAWILRVTKEITIKQKEAIKRICSWDSW